MFGQELLLTLLLSFQFLNLNKGFGHGQLEPFLLLIHIIHITLVFLQWFAEMDQQILSEYARGTGVRYGTLWIEASNIEYGNI